MFLHIRQNYARVLCAIAEYMFRKEMSHCENCNDSVATVWKHLRPTETMTHRRAEWLCANCHPRMGKRRRQTSA